ncbi:hypothetical protein QJS66_14410 [Kocuria rhizophila]|nr:hypothetical protein QJS66_14410 [Kocuria rhizophila]
MLILDDVLRSWDARRRSRLASSCGRRNRRSSRRPWTRTFPRLCSELPDGPGTRSRAWSGNAARRRCPPERTSTRAPEMSYACTGDVVDAAAVALQRARKAAQDRGTSRCPPRPRPRHVGVRNRHGGGTGSPRLRSRNRYGTDPRQLGIPGPGRSARDPRPLSSVVDTLMTHGGKTPRSVTACSDWPPGGLRNAEHVARALRGDGGAGAPRLHGDATRAAADPVRDLLSFAEKSARASSPGWRSTALWGPAGSGDAGGAGSRPRDTYG